MKWVVLLLVVGSFCYETVGVSVTGSGDSVKSVRQLEKAENSSQNEKESETLADVSADTNRSHSNESEDLVSDSEASKAISTKSEHKADSNVSPVDDDDDKLPPFPVVYSSSSSNSGSDEIAAEKIETGTANRNSADTAKPSVNNSPTDFLEPNSPWIQHVDASDDNDAPIPGFDSNVYDKADNPMMNEESDTEVNQSENEKSDEESPLSDPSDDNVEPSDTTTALQTHSADKSSLSKNIINLEALPPNNDNESDKVKPLALATTKKGNTTRVTTEKVTTFLPSESDADESSSEVESLKVDDDDQDASSEESFTSTNAPFTEAEEETQVLPSIEPILEEKVDETKPTSSLNVAEVNNSSLDSNDTEEESVKKSNETVFEEKGDESGNKKEPKVKTSFSEEIQPQRQSDSSEHKSEEREIAEHNSSETMTGDKIDSQPKNSSSDTLESKTDTILWESPKNASQAGNTVGGVESNPVLSNDFAGLGEVKKLSPNNTSASRFSSDKDREDSNDREHIVRQKPRRPPTARLLLIDEDDASSFYSCVKHSCHEGFVFNPTIRTCEQADAN